MLLLIVYTSWVYFLQEATLQCSYCKVNKPMSVREGRVRIPFILAGYTTYRKPLASVPIVKLANPLLGRGGQEY